MGIFDPLGEATEEENAFFQEDEANQKQVEREVDEEERAKTEDVKGQDVEEAEEAEETEETEEEHENKHVPLQELLKERKWRQDIGRQLEAERKRFETANERLQRLYEAMDKRVPAKETEQHKETKEELPDRSKDPLGYVLAKMELMEREVARRERESTQAAETIRKQNEEYSKQQQNIQRFQSDLSSAEDQFRQVAPDYDDAFDFVTKSRDGELALLGYNPQQRQQIIIQEATQTAAHLLSQGINPAEKFYEFAKQRGYGRPKAEPNKVQKLAETEKKTKTPGRGKASNTGKPTIDALSEMDDAEFDKWFEVLYKET